MKISLLRTEIPMEEEQLQALLAKGLIKQERSDEEEMCRIFGLTYKKNPLEVPRFEVDESIIIELLENAKFEPVENDASTISTNMHLANKYSKDVNVSYSNIYIKMLHGLLITEIGFSFVSSTAEILNDNLNQANVTNTIDEDKRMVYVPFFTTQWNDNKDKYEYSNINMGNFSQWLDKSFSHANIPYEIGELLKGYSKEIERHDYSKNTINFNEVSRAILHLEEQFSLEKKQKTSLVNNESDHFEKDIAKAIKLSVKGPGFYTTPTQVPLDTTPKPVEEDVVNKMN